MKAVCLIPLRAGSQSIPNKNIRPLAGKPLAAWTIAAAAYAELIDDLYVSTECPNIASVVTGLRLGATVIRRPQEYATDTATTESVMLHFMSIVKFDLVVTIQATSPLLTSEVLDNALRQFRREHLDSMLSVVRTKRFFWNDDSTPINYTPSMRPRRQDFRGTLMENGAFYITKRRILEQDRCRLGGKIGLHVMDESSAVEIDEPEDWERVEKLILARGTSGNDR